MNLVAAKVALTSVLLALATVIVSIVFVEEIILSSMLMSGVWGLGVIALLSSLVAIWSIK